MAAPHTDAKTAEELLIVQKLYAITTALHEFNNLYKTYSGGSSATLAQVITGGNSLDTIKPNYDTYYKLLSDGKA